MKFWFSMPMLQVPDWPIVAKHAEAVGIHGVCMGDHLANPKQYRATYPNLEEQGGKRQFDGHLHPSPLLMISAMSAVTTELRFTIGVFLAPLLHPIMLAKDVAVASRLAGGRFEFGIGVGWMPEEFESLGLDFESRGRRMDEMVDLMREFWSGDYVAADTEFFKWEPTRVVPYPIEPVQVPLIFGGHTKPALRRTARVGDGWISMPAELEELTRCIKKIEEGRRAHGREDQPFEVRLVVSQYPDRDMVKRYESVGVTSIDVPQWMMGNMAEPNLQDSIDRVSKLADDIHQWQS